MPHAQVSCASNDVHLADEKAWRLSALPDSEVKAKEYFRSICQPQEFELTIPWSDEEIRNAPFEAMISLWFETREGTFAMELADSPRTDRARQVIASWQGGRRGEQSLAHRLVPEKRYYVWLQPGDTARVYGVVGIKVLNSTCDHEPARLTEFDADPKRGYWWPFLLVRPDPPAAGAPRRPGAGTLLVVPNNTGAATDDIAVMRAMARCALDAAGDIDAVAIAKRLGTPILMPLFPRPELKEISSNLQLQALTRASLEEPLPRLARLDRQLIAMIDAARDELARKLQWPVRVQRRVLMVGFSAAGQFTQRFTLLHPDRVLAAAAGAPGSWPVAPVATYRGVRLRYPVGVADVEQLTGKPVDLAALRRVHALYFRARRDTNDTVDSGDNYTRYDSDLIERLFGKSIRARWCSARALFRAAGFSRLQFRLYAGNAHEVTTDMRKDVVRTFRAALADP